MTSPDKTLPPKPTGRAASLAAAHSTPNPNLQLYGSWFCPFVQRAWIVLAEKHIPHEYVEINPYDKTAEFLALNPRGGRREKKTLYESTVICEFLDERFADEGVYGPRLMPASGGGGGREGEREVFERARCRLWVNHVATRVVPGFYRLLQHTHTEGEEGSGSSSIGEVRAGFVKGLREFAKEMVDSGSGRDGPWFLGAKFSLVDVALAPWAKRLFLIDHYKEGGVGIPKEGERGDDEEVWARWDCWFNAVVERESVKATWSDDDKYIEAYKRYADNTTQSEVGEATRKGRSLP